MTMSDELRELINKEATKDLLRISARRNGMVTLLEFSMCLVRDGFTDLDEVIRVTLTDEGTTDPVPVTHYYTLDGKGLNITHDGRVVSDEEADAIRKASSPKKDLGPNPYDMPTTAPAAATPAAPAAAPTAAPSGSALAADPAAPAVEVRRLEQLRVDPHGDLELPVRLDVLLAERQGHAARGVRQVKQCGGLALGRHGVFVED